jgi:hypothetical protein
MGAKSHVASESRGRLRHRLGGWLAPARRELERARRAADAELLRLALPPPRLAWRSAELTAGSRRLELARELRKVVEAADGRYLPSASPIDRVRIHAEGDALCRLADRLAELSRPVAPRGVLLLERILHDVDGPLYQGAASTSLDDALARVAEALEAHL